MSVRENIAGKLRAARRLSGLSTRAVADKLLKRFPISHATIANYESAKTVPPMDILAALAWLYERPINWFLEGGLSLTGVRYRNLRSRVRISQLHQFEASVQRWLEAYVAIESRLKQSLQRIVDLPKNPSDLAPADLSRQIRHKVGIAEDEPIPSVVEVLEKFGVRVLEESTPIRIDGLAALYGGEYVTVLNPTVSNDRGRLNAAHELAHVLFKDCEKPAAESREQETRAFEFGSHLLMPNSQLKRAFSGKSMVRLVQFKERFGISLAAMVYRADKLGFITRAETKMLWIEFAKRGWRSREPGYVRPDRATRFEQLVEEALESHRMSLQEIANLAGVRTEDIRRRLNLAIGALDQNCADDQEPPTIKLHSK
jgi:Zn-dependent peptidase ImmA (M78 family)